MTTKDQAIAPVSRDADADHGKVLSVYGNHKPAPDCRTCVNYDARGNAMGHKCMQDCTNGDSYVEALKVVLWRTV